MNRWTLIFKALANINRLKIIKLLTKEKSLSVSEIAEVIDISLNATSKHLIILSNLAILEGEGQQGHVFYHISYNLPDDIKRSINLFLK